MATWPAAFGSRVAQDIMVVKDAYLAAVRGQREKKGWDLTILL
jgi:hypothetical protein